MNAVPRRIVIGHDATGTSVVLSDGPVPVMSRNAVSASWTAWSSAPSRSPAGGPASSGRSASMTAALAGAPRPWRPKPSATASRRAPAYAESSLASRTLPMSDLTA